MMVVKGVDSSSSEEEFAYVNQKHFYSINVQIICDAQMRLTNIVARWPGSTHDSYILTNSMVGMRLQAGCAMGGFLVSDAFKVMVLSNCILLFLLIFFAFNYSTAHQETAVIH